MKIGKEKETIIVEPIQNPVPEREPANPPERAPVKQPEKEPVRT
jgi:hypothetical protein